MTVFDQIGLLAPYIRVNNRQQNIDFYTQTLGMRLLHEENALSLLGGHDQKETRLVLEESPAVRTRAVVGVKKLQRLELKANPEEIAELLAHRISVQQVYRGACGYAFSVLSPEGDLILLHGEEDVSTLEICDYPDLVAISNQAVVSDVTVTKICLHTDQIDALTPLYSCLPVAIDLIEAQGQDLAVPANETWDLESLELTVPETADLVDLQAAFEVLGARTFLNRRQTLLVVTAPNQVEFWVMKR